MYKKHIFLAFTIFSLSIGAAEVLEGRVVGVHDGDTVTLLMAGNHQVKIRLAQIDAPESNQAFGQKSKQSLSDIVFNKTKLVEAETIDKYGRTVGTILVDGLDVNREQIKRCMAWAYLKYLHDQSLLQVEMDACQARLGCGLIQTQCHLGSIDTVETRVVLLIEPQRGEIRSLMQLVFPA